MLDKEKLEIIEGYVKEGVRRGYTCEDLIKSEVFKAYIDNRVKWLESNKEKIFDAVYFDILGEQNER